MTSDGAETSRIQNAIGVVEHPIGVAERRLASRMRDFTGERIGESVVVGRMGSAGAGKSAQRLWVLRCDCDTEFLLTTNRITLAKRLGDGICCRTCRRELRGGKSVVKANIAKDFYLSLWDSRHSLWTRQAEDRLSLAVMNDLIEEFGPLTEQEGEPNTSSMTIDPSWSQNEMPDPEQAVSFVERYFHAPVCSAGRAFQEAPARTGIGEYPRPGAYASVASRYGFEEYDALINAAYKRAKAAPLAEPVKSGQRKPPEGMIRPDRERLAQVARDAAMAPAKPPPHRWSPNRAQSVGAHEAQICSECTCGRRFLVSVVRDELEAILRQEDPAAVGRYGQPQEGRVLPIGWQGMMGEYALIQRFSDGHQYLGVLFTREYAEGLLKLMRIAESSAASREVV